MPALQVRDFPEELYERLKEYAELNHRSIAQQTIVAVEQMIAADNKNPHQENRSSQPSSQRLRFSLNSEAECARRAKKRKEIFAQADQIHWKGTMPTGEEIVSLVHEGRENNEASTLAACGFYDELKSYENADKDGEAPKSSTRKKHGSQAEESQ